MRLLGLLVSLPIDVEDLLLVVLPADAHALDGRRRGRAVLLAPVGGPNGDVEAVGVVVGLEDLDNIIVRLKRGGGRCQSRPGRNYKADRNKALSAPMRVVGSERARGAHLRHV